MYPVYIYEEGMELPQQGTYFVVAGNGLWLHKDTGVVKALVPVKNISFLPDLNVASFVQCSLPKIPAFLVQKIKHFFREVVDCNTTEVNTIICFNKKTNEYKIHVPKQIASHSAVGFKWDDAEEGFLCVGTIHSHCDFNAFHSGVDDIDENDFDGLHCTFGHNNLDEFSISASVVVNGHRSIIDPLDVLDGIQEVQTSKRYRLISDEKIDVSDWTKNVIKGRVPHGSNAFIAEEIDKAFEFRRNQ